jgi:Protein of unknown function (DUF2510)
MAQPGWFPDPGGQPGMFRYWDGAAWTQQLSADPPLSAPPGRNNRNGLVLGLIVGVVLLALIAFFVIPRLVGGAGPTATRSVPTGSPTGSAWDETSRPTPTRTPTPTPTSSEPPETSLPCPRYDEAVVKGRLYGGGLSVPVIDDPRWSVNAVRSIPWAICATGLERSIAPTWVSEVILAGIQPRSKTGSLEEQALAISSDSLDRFYKPNETTLKMLSSKATTVDGLDAWELRYEVRVDYLDNIPGDNVNVVVVQHTDGSRSALLTFATIGDTQTQRQVDNCRDTVRVEKR